MAAQILPENRAFTPSPATVRFVLDVLNEERETHVALSIALTERMEKMEEGEDGASTELVLLRHLNDQLNSIETLQLAEALLRGVEPDQVRAGA
jgi:hypothetical protein